MVGAGKGIAVIEVTDIKAERLFIGAVVEWLKTSGDHRSCRLTDEPAKTLLWKLEGVGLKVVTRG